MYWFQNDYSDFHFQPRHTKDLLLLTKKEIKQNKNNLLFHGWGTWFGHFLNIKETPNFQCYSRWQKFFFASGELFPFYPPQKRKTTIKTEVKPSRLKTIYLNFSHCCWYLNVLHVELSGFQLVPSSTVKLETWFVNASSTAWLWLAEGATCWPEKKSTAWDMRWW